MDNSEPEFHDGLVHKFKIQLGKNDFIIFFLYFYFFFMLHVLLYRYGGIRLQRFYSKPSQHPILFHIGL